MSWHVIDHTTIYREDGWDGAHPNVVRTPGGDLLALFHRSPDIGFACHAHPMFDARACRSSDEGATWGLQEFVTCDPLGGVIDFGTHTLPDGSIFLHASSNALVPCEHKIEPPEWHAIGGIPFWTRSRDDGRTWCPPVRFPPVPDAVWGHPASHSGVCRSTVAVLPDGRMLAPSKATDHADGSMPFFGMLRVSPDLGETWQYGGRIAEDAEAHFSEPTIHRTPSGKLLVLYRCHAVNPADPKGGVYLALVESDDDGRTWSPWRHTTLRGCPGHLLGLRDGRIFATVGARYPGTCGCTARVLNPEATDLDTAPDVIVRPDSLSADCGYPWSVELKDGRVLVVYYYTYPDGLRGIEGTILEEA